MGRLAAVALALVIAGCGGESASVPKGSPDTRHSAATVDAYASIELLRGLMVASSDSYYAGGSADDAANQLGRARAAYDSLRGGVRRGDAVVDREITVRFNRLERELERGIAPDRYRDLAAPLTDQLMDGALQALVPAAARTDRGVQAEALRRVTARLAATYVAATSSGDAQGRLAFEEAWGLWRRALALNALIKSDLGPQKDRVSSALNDLRDSAFPDGPAQPATSGADDMEEARADVVEALTERFRL